MQTAWKMYDWKVAELHYANYSLAEREEMCTLNRCQKCETKTECDAAKRKSYQEFLAQVH